MTLLQVPTVSRNAPSRFPVQFHPRWDLRLPFPQKIFSENRKKSKKSFRSLSKSKQEKNSRLKSDFSNLVKSRIPDPSINLVRYTIYCLQRTLHVMHKVQLANGASHGHNSFPTHPSRRPLLHNFPIMGSPELSQC